MRTGQSGSSSPVPRTPHATDITPPRSIGNMGDGGAFALFTHPVRECGVVETGAQEHGPRLDLFRRGRFALDNARHGGALQLDLALAVIEMDRNEGYPVFRDAAHQQEDVDRYDGVRRNPFNEYECGHWYARAMSSYGLLQGLTGVRYDAVDKTLYVDSKIGDFKSFLSTASGFGNVEFKQGQVSLSVVSGSIDVEHTVVTNSQNKG
jgi:hypothetical protein